MIGFELRTSQLTRNEGVRRARQKLRTGRSVRRQSSKRDPGAVPAIREKVTSLEKKVLRKRPDDKTVTVVALWLLVLVGWVRILG